MQPKLRNEFNIDMPHNLNVFARVVDTGGFCEGDFTEPSAFHRAISQMNELQSGRISPRLA